MTRFLSAALLLAALSVPVGAAEFPDKNLAAAVQAALRLPKPEFKDDDLAKLSVLDISGKGVKDLTGLEKCRGLAQLKATKNEIAKLDALKDMPVLQSLDLEANKIADITPLAGLAKLQYLELTGNQISDLKPLEKLTALASLYLTGNKVTEVTPLSALTKLASLNLGDNQIKDIKPLAKLTRITTLELRGNPITDLAPLAGFTDLKLLMADKCQVADLGAVVKWAKADADGPKRFAPYMRLYIAGNPLSDEAKKQVAELKKIGVRVEDLK